MDLDPNRDGVDHINIFSRAKTPLGRNLTNLNNIPVDVDGHGRFSSMEAVWFYGRIFLCGKITPGLKQELMAMGGWDAKKAMRDFPMKDMMTAWDDEKELSFRTLICTSSRAKIDQHENIKRAFLQSTLPFTHYYVYGRGDKFKVVNAGHEWQVKYLAAYRDFLKGINSDNFLYFNPMEK